MRPCPDTASPRNQRVEIRSIVGAHRDEPPGEAGGISRHRTKEDGADAAFPDQPKLGLRFLVLGPGFLSEILRKEVIQPQVPLRLPCYDLVPITGFIFGACL